MSVPPKIGDGDCNCIGATWYCLVSCCARVNSVGGFGNCRLIFLTTGGVLC